MKEKVLLGMSGGLDSTYSVVELQKKGYDVVGAVLKMSDNTDVEKAKTAAETLGVPLHVVDCSKRFEDVVVQDFLTEYAAARTPNPCVICNRYVKI
jgi:tRNA-specific 2-thiouridylase